MRLLRYTSRSWHCSSHLSRRAAATNRTVSSRDRANGESFCRINRPSSSRSLRVSNPSARINASHARSTAPADWGTTDSINSLNNTIIYIVYRGHVLLWTKRNGTVLGYIRSLNWDHQSTRKENIVVVFFISIFLAPLSLSLFFGDNEEKTVNYQGIPYLKTFMTKYWLFVKYMSYWLRRITEAFTYCK